MSEPYSARSLPKSVVPLSGYLLNRFTADDLKEALEPFRSDWEGTSPETSDRPLSGAELPWRVWLETAFPHVCTAPFSARHARLWEWFEGLTPGQKPPARVEVWPRGGAKSSTAELGCVRLGVKLTRRFVLYVSETQDQADKHVQSVGSLFENLQVERAVNKYGSSKGWRRDQLRTANGFNVAAYGLDAAARGVKLDHYRPDLIIFDDLDHQDDSTRTIEKKVGAITTAIIPAGAKDCAYLFLQNLIHEESIFAQLVDGRADFLHNRDPACVEPAVRGLAYEREDRGDGQNVYRVTGGAPTWAGQNLVTCEEQINEWGLRAFLREAQHEVAGGAGYVFDVSQLRYVEPAEVPPLVSVCLAWDLAATEGGGNWTVGVLLGVAENGVYYVLAVIRGQWSSERVRWCIRRAEGYYHPFFQEFQLRLPQDPGQAGKDQAGQFRGAFPGATVQPVTGKKWTRATGFAEQVNLGNVCLVNQDLPAFLAARAPEIGDKPLVETLSYRAWQMAFREGLRKFREEVLDQADDDVDAASDAFNALVLGEGEVETDPAEFEKFWSQGRERD
jgi:phage terminase large subunit-like protein